MCFHTISKDFLVLDFIWMSLFFIFVDFISVLGLKDDLVEYD